MGKFLKRAFHNGEKKYQIAYKKCLASLVIRGMKTKIRMLDTTAYSQTLNV